MTVVAEALLHFHHVYSAAKRSAMRGWAMGDEAVRGTAQGPVRVVCRTGRPGRVFVSGSPEAVRDFQLRVKRLRWQSVRLESSTVRAGSEDETEGRGYVEVASNDDFLAAVEAIRRRSSGL